MEYILRYPNPPLEEVLAHHGVKGQKWGIRRNRDSSTGKVGSASPSVQAKREAKAKEAQAVADHHQAKINELTAKLPNAKWYQRDSINRDIKIHTEVRDVALKDVQNHREGKLTEGQKTLIKGAAITAGILAAYGTYKVVQSGQANAWITDGRNFLDKKGVSPWKMNPELSKKGMSIGELEKNVVSHVNPGYGAIGTKVNCKRCTYAYELRRRGYDVAATRTTTGSGQTMSGTFNALKSVTDESKFISMKPHAGFAVDSHGTVAATPFRTLKMGNRLGAVAIKKEKGDAFFGQSIFRSLEKEPEGARGELGVKWLGGGGHSVAWEIIGGKPVVFDCQSGQTFDNPFKLFGHAGIEEAGYTRLDDKPLNHEFLKRWVKNA